MAEKQRRPALHTMSDAIRELLPYTQLGWQLVAAILLFFGTGYLLDRWLETDPVLTIVFAMIGVVAGLLTVIKSALELEQKRKSKER